ncbi:MAG: hypothetical protein AAF799_07320 [Myxococcota bacterium]
MREVGVVGQWKYQHHRMARFEDGKLFAFLAANDDDGKEWGWVVMLPGREPKERTTGVSNSALEGARACDAVAAELVKDEPDPDAVARWATEHLQWRTEADQGETESTLNWSGSAS